MKLNNIFQTFARVFIVVFLVLLILNLNPSTNSSDYYKEKIINLQIEKTSASNTSWLAIDEAQVRAHLELGMKNLQNSNFQQFKKNIKTSKFLIADEEQSPLFLELEKAEKILENVTILQIKLQALPMQSQHFVKLIIKESPELIGNLIEENDDFISIKDTSGFTTPINKKSIESIIAIDQKEKAIICSDLLSKLLEDNGKSSYGLYLSAKWAYQNDLQNIATPILVEAALNDPKILITINECEAKIILNNAILSNLNGDYDIAKENAMKIISTYSNTTQNSLNLINNDLTPSIKTTQTSAKKTLTIRNQTTGELREDSVSKQIISNDKEILEEKLMDKTSLLNKTLYQEKPYQDAAELIEQGGNLLKIGMSIDNPGSKKAQINFKNALIKFEAAKKMLAKINKKYEGNKDLEALNKLANEMHFMLNKNLIRLQ